MKFRAVLFDLDNTLVDFMGMKRAASKTAASAMVDAGLDADKEVFADELFSFYLNRWIESDDAFEAFLLEKYNKVDYRILAAGVNAYLKEKYLHLKPYPGVKETLAELKKMGLKLAVVSDGVRLKAWMRLNAAGLDKYFDVVVTHEDTCKKKPCPEPFQKALKELGLRPDECLFVGDWPERDIEGAKAVGMQACLAEYGLVDKSKKHNGEYEIKNIKDLLEIIKR
jgi:HAD superfamily hydrolase (TIGR02253 family)